MKINLLIISCMAVLSLTLQSCHDDSDDPAPEDEYLARLSATWVLNEVTINDTEVSDAFDGLELTITSKRKLTIKNPVPPIWPASGSFHLEKDPDTSDYIIVREEDGVEIWVLELTATSVVLEFWYQPPTGRSESVNGIYRFYFTKK